MSAVQKAVYARLQAALPAGTLLYDHVPARLGDDAWDGSPLVQLADISESKIHGSLRRVTVLVIVWSAERSRVAAQALRDAVVLALDEQPLPAQPGFILSEPVLTNTTDGALGETTINRTTASFALFQQKE